MPRLIGVFVECTTIFWFCLHSLIHFYGTLGLIKQEIDKKNSVDIDKTLQYASHLGLHCLFVSILQ